MALPTLQKSYNFSLCNQLLWQGAVDSDNKLLFLTFLNAMLAMGWSVDYSCDGTTAGTVADGVNRITAVNKVVLALNGSAAHSWVILKNTTLHPTLRLKLSASTGSGSYFNSYMTVVIGVSFVSGYTGGTTVSDPTATDGVTIFDTAGMGNSRNWLYVANVPQPSSSTSYRWSRLSSTDGTITRFFITSGAGHQFHFGVEVPTVYDSTGWNNPCVVWVNNADAGPISPSSYIRIASTTGLCTFLTLGDQNGRYSNQAIGQVANEADSTWFMPTITIGGAAAGVRGVHGAFIDLWYGSNGVASADSYNSSGSLQFAQLGNLIYPWNGSTTITLV